MSLRPSFLRLSPNGSFLRNPSQSSRPRVMTSGVQAAKDKWLEPRESEGTPFGITHICAFYFPSFFLLFRKKIESLCKQVPPSDPLHHRAHRRPFLIWEEMEGIYLNFLSTVVLYDLVSYFQLNARKKQGGEGLF